MTYLGQKGILVDLFQETSFIQRRLDQCRLITFCHFWAKIYLKPSTNFFLQCSPLEYPYSASLSSIPTGNEKNPLWSATSVDMMTHLHDNSFTWWNNRMTHLHDDAKAWQTDTWEIKAWKAITCIFVYMSNIYMIAFLH